VDADPAFAPAWAKLGRCYRLVAKYYIEDVARNLAQAEECFRRALELDPELPVAHKLYAHHQSEMGRSRDAMTGLLGLARKNPNDPEIFAGLVHACRYCGLLDSSEAAHREARRLDPHAWTSVVYNWWARGDAARIVEESSDASDFELRALALVELGRRPEAVEVLKQVAHRPLPKVFATICHGLLDLLAGQPAAATQLAEIVKVHQDPEAFFLFATILAYFGDSTTALAELVRSVERGFTVPLALRSHPWLASLRAGPGFPALVERAEAERAISLAAFREAGGEALLGAAG
jgi:eukaryotic-like serine/threonine-protein kinase